MKILYLWHGVIMNKKILYGLILLLTLSLTLGAVSASDDFSDIKAVGNATANSSSKEAIEALVSLGYTQSEASLAVGRLDQSLDTNTLIKQALKSLARGL